jgi:hypothetical protein
MFWWGDATSCRIYQITVSQGNYLSWKNLWTGVRTIIFGNSIHWSLLCAHLLQRPLDKSDDLEVNETSHDHSAPLQLFSGLLSALRSKHWSCFVSSFYSDPWRNQMDWTFRTKVRNTHSTCARNASCLGTTVAESSKGVNRKSWHLYMIWNIYTTVDYVDLSIFGHLISYFLILVTRNREKKRHFSSAPPENK